MAWQLGHVAKQLNRCLCTLESFTDGQVLMEDCDWNKMTYVTFQISPTDGLYKGATFKFKVTFPMDYPNIAPVVSCRTPIYHPNIDGRGDDDNVCVSLLNEWIPSNTLEDVVQSLLFLLYNPNIEDPLSDLVPSDTEYVRFEENAKTIYQEGQNPLYMHENMDSEEELPEDESFPYVDENFFKLAIDQYNNTSREEWQKLGKERTAEWQKAMEDDKFVEKVKKWEEEEKVRVEEEERKKKEEEEQTRKQEEQEEKVNCDNTEVGGACVGHANEGEEPTVDGQMPQADGEEPKTENQEQTCTSFPPPDAQIFQFFRHCIQSFKAAAQRWLACGMTTQTDSESPPYERTTESRPLIANHGEPITRSLSETQLGTELVQPPAGPTEELQPVNSAVDLNSGGDRALAEPLTFESTTNWMNSESRPAYKRCVSC